MDLTPPCPSWPSKFIGTPYVWGQSDRESVDCWGLVHCVWSSVYKVDLPTFRDDFYEDSTENAARYEAVDNLIHTGTALFEKIDAARPLAIVLMRHKSYDAHCGLYVTGGDILEASEYYGKVVRSRLQNQKNKIIGYYWPSDAMLKTATLSSEFAS